MYPDERRPAVGDVPSPPAVPTSVPLQQGLDALEAFGDYTAGVRVPDGLRRVVASEIRVLADAVQEMGDRFEDRSAVPGPVQAILIDPVIPSLGNDADLKARVRYILEATQPPSRWAHAWRPLLVVIVMLGLLTGSLTAFYMGITSVGVMPIIAVMGMGSMLMFSRRSADSRGPWLGYTRISEDDALEVARLRRALRVGGSTLSSWPHETNSVRRRARVQWMRDDQAKSVSPEVPAAGSSGGDRARRIADVHAAVAELDREWLEYQLDLHAWFLAKPQLRNLNDPVIRAFRDADAELRDRADELTSTASDAQIDAAQDAARRALTAWGEANDHALKLGVSDLSPSEEAALKRLEGLVGTLIDRGTPREMRPQIIARITSTMAKLTVTPFVLSDIVQLPELEAPAADQR